VGEGLGVGWAGLGGAVEHLGEVLGAQGGQGLDGGEQEGAVAGVFG
jgi:hypothetical protein